MDICVTHIELAVNLLIETIDTELPVESVYCNGTLSTADNIAFILHSPWFTEPGVDTAAYLIMKGTIGYGNVTGGAATDGGNPDRVNGRPL